ncbi:MAG: hypothetical protein SPI34_00225 [Opitutales bacterium]|nr:hypothetical protein [Opitutales bacterium]
MRPKKKAHLIGMAFESDGEKRITEAENFSIVGGTEEVHEAMSETAIKTMETLKRKGKSLETVSSKELGDILRENMPDM